MTTRCLACQRLSMRPFGDSDTCRACREQPSTAWAYALMITVGLFLGFVYFYAAAGH